MAHRLYSSWFVAARCGSPSVPVNFWDDAFADHHITYVVRTISLHILTGTGKGWVQLHGPVPPHAPTGEPIAQVNNLFTTPVSGPVTGQNYSMTMPLPRGSRLELHTSGPLVYVAVGGWRLQQPTTTSGPTRY